MNRSATRTGLSGLLAVVLLAVGCTESLGPARGSPGAPRFDVAANGIAPDQVNGTFHEDGTAGLLKGFNPTNPHLGDAIIATFYWVASTNTNIITSVTDRLADGTPVGNTYTPVEFVSAGGISMATYVATNVQNFPEGTFPSGEKILVVAAALASPIQDGGIMISAFTGVSTVSTQALGGHSKAFGAGSSYPTVADPGALAIGANALAFGVTMSNGVVGVDPPAGFTTLDVLSDAFMVTEANYLVQGAAGSVDPQWSWHFTSPSTWLATALVLNPPAPAPGNLTVTTSTSGTSLPGGYTVTVDGATSQSIGINGSVTFSGLSAGSHSVALSGVAANCVVSGGSSQTVTVPAGGTVTASYTVSCSTTSRLTGGGKLGDGRTFATFGSEAKQTGGELEWVQHCLDGVQAGSPGCPMGNFTFHGTMTVGSYGPVTGSPTCRTWSGTGTANVKDVPSKSGTYSFTVNAACDNGEPGRGTDFIDITIGGYHNSGYLTGGNIQRQKTR